MNIFRFKELLESKLGNVKPLLMEVTSSEQSQEKTSINNLFSKFVNLIKSDNKIKNWSLNIFKKENPSQKELLDYIKGPKQTPKSLTPTTPPAVTGQTSGSTQTNLTESTNVDPYTIFTNNKGLLIQEVNQVIQKYIIPKINNYLNSNTNKWYGSCYDVWPFGETCFGVHLTVKFNGLILQNVTLTRGSGKVIVKANIYAGLSLDNFILGTHTNFYPKINGTLEIIGKEKIVIPPPTVSLWTNWVDAGVVYVYINDNFLKMHNRYVGPYEWSLPIQYYVNKSFKEKVIYIQKDLPGLYQKL